MNSGNLDSKEIIKGKTEGSVMQERIGFVDSDSRKQFFLAVREASGVQSWDKLAELFNICRSQFQKYQYGKILLPEKLFNSMLEFLPKEKQESFAPFIFKKPANWGIVKGGENNYKKNSEKIIAKLREGFQRKVASGDTYWGPHCVPKQVDLSIPLSTELCELIGAIIGDGYVDSHVDEKGKSKYHIQIVGNSTLDKDYLLITLSTIAKNVFGINTNHYFRKDKKALNLNLHSKQLFVLLTKRFGFPIGPKTFTIKIPEEIMNSEEKFVFATIRGIFDTDGCVFLDKRKIYNKIYPRISLQTVSEPLFLQLKGFLSKHFSLYTYHNIKRHNYYVEVYGHKQVEKWMKLIGFSNSRNLRKVEACGGDQTLDLHLTKMAFYH